ncbi:PucR family transcriptional regulator [Streptomyces sp. NPDC058375]|uniref:PucR family transcriptional regulator n=1 Tax=Streptomyces sp. NPDC058375 TaxID=3346467 RepID=UPI00364F9068
MDLLHAASLSRQRMRAATEDPALFASTRRSSLADVLRWSLANVHHPGDPVPTISAAEAAEIARNLVRSGIDERGLEAYRVSQNVAWQLWMPICFDLTRDPAELQELLEVSWLSMTTFIDDTVAAVSVRMETERAELLRDAQAERRAIVTLLLEGAPVASARAEAELGYPLGGWHTAAIVWSDASSSSGELEAVTEAVMRMARATRRLTIAVGASALWIWLPAADVPALAQMSEVLSDSPHVRVAFGRPATGIDGFRRSHFDAVATQRMLARLDSPQQAARYEDVQLVAMLANDPTQVDEFLRDTLGRLLHADIEIQRTVDTYVRERCNVTGTAKRMFTHRNTVIRRLGQADELLPRPLAENVVSVAAALDVLRWRQAE